MVSPKLVSKRGADRSLRGDALDIAECQLGQGSLLRPHYPLRSSTSASRSPESASTTTAAHGGAIRVSRAFRQDPTRARLRAHGSPDDDAHSGAIRIPDGGGFLQPYSCADGERYHRLLSRGQPLRGHTGVSTAVPLHIGDAFRQNPTRARLRAHSSPDDEAHGGAIRIPDGGGFLHPYSCADGERRRLLSRGQPLRGICRRILSGVRAPRQPRRRHPRRCHPYPRRWWLPPALQLCRRREAPTPEPRAAPTMIHRRIHDCTFRQNPTRARLRTHSSPDDNEHGGAIRIPDGGGFRQPYSCADGERHRFLSRGQPPRGHAGAHPDDSTERGALDDADIFTRQMLSTSDLRPSTFDLDFHPLPTSDRLAAKPLTLYRRLHAS